jgi:hypothetical protein
MNRPAASAKVPLAAGEATSLGTPGAPAVVVGMSPTRSRAASVPASKAIAQPAGRRRIISAGGGAAALLHGGAELAAAS